MNELNTFYTQDQQNWMWYEVWNSPKITLALGQGDQAETLLTGQNVQLAIKSQIMKEGVYTNEFKEAYENGFFTPSGETGTLANAVFNEFAGSTGEFRIEMLPIEGRDDLFISGEPAQDGSHAMTFHFKMLVTPQEYQGLPPVDPYDVSGDGEIDIEDLKLIAKDYGTNSCDSQFHNIADYNGDGVIDLFDLVNLAKKIE